MSPSNPSSPAVLSPWLVDPAKVASLHPVTTPSTIFAFPGDASQIKDVFSFPPPSILLKRATNTAQKEIYLSGRASVGSPGYFNPGSSPGRMGARLPSVDVQSPPVIINSPKKEQTRIKPESNLLGIPTEVASETEDMSKMETNSDRPELSIEDTELQSILANAGALAMDSSEKGGFSMSASGSTSFTSQDLLGIESSASRAPSSTGRDSVSDTESSLDGANPRYKTEVCRNFKEGSKCVYGDQCQFAHGRRELREVVRNSKYKTKHCQKYWLTGYCVYGPRCNFLHNEVTLEDEQYLKRKMRSNSIGSTHSLNQLNMGAGSSNDLLFTPSLPVSRCSSFSGHLSFTTPPPPLIMSQNMGSLGDPFTGGKKPGGSFYRHNNNSYGRTPPPTSGGQQQHYTDIFAEMDKWSNDQAPPTPTTQQKNLTLESY